MDIVLLQGTYEPEGGVGGTQSEKDLWGVLYLTVYMFCKNLDFT